MEFLHTGLAVSSEVQSDRFFVGVLGMEKTAAQWLAAPLMRVLFDIDRELSVIKYRAENVVYEVFVCPEHIGGGSRLVHSCIAVSDPAAVVEKCRREGFSVIEAVKDSRIVTFVDDFDGNRFELKMQL